MLSLAVTPPKRASNRKGATISDKDQYTITLPITLRREGDGYNHDFRTKLRFTVCADGPAEAARRFGEFIVGDAPRMAVTFISDSAYDTEEIIDLYESHGD